MGSQWRKCHYRCSKSLMQKYYVRFCFIFTLLEAVPRLYSWGSMLFSGERILWSLLYLTLYTILVVSAFRMFRNHHIPSAKGIVTLRFGLIIATGAHFLLMKPMPPITLLFAPLVLPTFQLYFAHKAHRSLISLTPVIPDKFTSL